MSYPLRPPTQAVQRWPYPHDLADLVACSHYRPGWHVDLDHVVRDHVDPADDTSPALSEGLTLTITTRGYDTYHPERGEHYGVRHLFPVPPATYVRDDWRRWLFGCYLLVEQHEAQEFFQADGERPYAPLHGPGRDPYVIHDVADDVARNTSFRGKVNG